MKTSAHLVLFLSSLRKGSGWTIFILINSFTYPSILGFIILMMKNSCNFKSKIKRNFGLNYHPWGNFETKWKYLFKNW
jgi:hypothetical protein